MGHGCRAQEASHLVDYRALPSIYKLPLLESLLIARFQLFEADVRQH